MGFDFNKFKVAMLQKDNLQKSIAQKQNLLSQLTGTVNKLKNAVQVATAYPTQPSTVTMNLPNGINLAAPATNQNVVLKTNSNYTSMMNVINGFIQVHTPYKMGGESKSGIDCSAFVQQAMKGANLKIPRTAREQFEATKKNLVCNSFNPNAMRPGDLIFFQNTQKGLGSGVASHVGIYLGNGKMAHSGGSTHGVGIVNLSTNYMKGKWLGVTRPAQNYFYSSVQNYNLASTNIQTNNSMQNLINPAIAKVAAMPTDAKLAAKYRQLQGVFNIAGQKTGVEPNLLAAIAANESDFNPNASGGPGTTVQGIFQIRPIDWNDGYKKGAKYGVSAMCSPKDNLQAALWVASRFAYNRDTGYYSKQCGIPNPTGLDFYMTHFLGEAGFRTLSNHLNEPLAPIMSKAARFNKSIFYDHGRARTGREIKQVMADKLAKKCREMGIAVPSLNNNSTVRNV